MKILVTGGAGFIGSNFVKYLIRKYPAYKIVNLDKLTYAGNLDNLKDVSRHKNYRFIKGDICDSPVVREAMKGCSWVVHFAAETHVDRSILDADRFIKTNVLGTRVLLEEARRTGIKRFLHVSTDEVYGSRAKGFFKEEDALNPSSPYSASKAASDLLARSYYVTYKTPVLITRSSNNFGPFQYPEKVIPLFVTNLLCNKKVPLYAKGDNIRDWIYVEDNCRAIDLVLHIGRVNEIYNIGGGNSLTNLSLAKSILKIMGKPLSMIKHVKDRPGHDLRYAIDCSKLKQLGFKPEYSFFTDLRSTVEWYERNKKWWRKVQQKKT